MVDKEENHKLIEEMKNKILKLFDIQEKSNE